MKQIWTEPEIELLRMHLNKPTTIEIYEQYRGEFGSNKRTYDSVQKKVRLLREAFNPDEQETIVEPTEVEETVLIPYGNEIVSIPVGTKASLKEARKNWLKDFVAFCRENKPNNCTVEQVDPKGTSLVVALSDVHFGQQNKGYDIEIATRRVAEIPVALNKIITVPINEIVFLMVGDMVEGEDIYPSQAHHIVCSCMEQVEAATMSLWRMIRDTQNTYKVPVRVVCVQGNHGRTNKGNSEKTNWDNVLYHSLKILCKTSGDKSIQVDCDYSEFKTFKVKDKVGLIYHEGVKHNGTPAMREKIAGWVYAKQMNFMVSGHWHEWKVGGWHEVLWMANGSLCGNNDLTERIAQEGPARQGYFFVTEGRPPWGFGFIEWK